MIAASSVKAFPVSFPICGRCGCDCNINTKHISSRLTRHLVHRHTPPHPVVDPKMGNSNTFFGLVAEHILSKKNVQISMDSQVNFSWFECSQTSSAWDSGRGSIWMARDDLQSNIWPTDDEQERVKLHQRRSFDHRGRWPQLVAGAPSADVQERIRAV